MKRIQEIDALRGFALFGIILTHMYQGYLASPVPPEYYGYNLVYPIDDTTRWIVRNLFSGKFYAIFSMLFGLSFYLILDRKQNSSPSKFAWRLVLLFLIGCINHIFYRGDFLTVYAVFGFVLLLARHLPSKYILVLGLFLTINGPTMILKLLSLFGYTPPFDPYIPMGPSPAEATNTYVDLILHGDLKSVLDSNSTIGFINKYNFMFQSGRVWVLPGLFLLGLWIGRQQYHEQLERLPLKKLMAISALIGVPLVLIHYNFYTADHSQFVQFIAFVAKETSNIFIPLFYIGLVFWLYNRKPTQGLVKKLVPVGRMGLSTYVMQSGFGIIIFYGYGLGMFLKLSATLAIGLGILIFIIQTAFSVWWFKRFKYGPLEWLWRSGTHLKWQPMRLHTSTTLKKPTA
ncbi:DUF418 domain-containing protein [Gaetbulibacter sp. M240]|uniref:DUF418 domain-containing protein n=1 Tax=Gaetbulibacter sp. M240 TaxID=3126511 RepID=UPI00374E31E6